MDLEAVLLTGGASERMGQDKSALMAGRIIAALDTIPVTVLGRTPIEGLAFLADESDYPGPARALSRYEPRAKAVIVCACDLPLFNKDCIAELTQAIDDKEAAIPLVDGREQYLCALYRSNVFPTWRHMVESGTAVSMRELVRVLDAVYFAPIGAKLFTGANTPEELQALQGE